MLSDAAVVSGSRCSRRRSALLLCSAIIVASACSSTAEESKTLDIATTTSVVNSGLLAWLLPEFQKDTGVTVRVHAAGSGRALEMLNDQVIDLAISHAPQAESRMLAKHADWNYVKIATNQFVLVGPATDPADVRNASDITTAFKRLAGAGVDFISRGDGSGTHERESELWDAAGVRPAPGRLLVSGGGMGTTLRQADERRGYTLSDDSTFLQLQDDLSLTILVANDPRLVNSYAVIYPRRSPLASRLADWLGRGNGRRMIGAYHVGGMKVFAPWPEGCPGDQPTSPLCR